MWERRDKPLSELGRRKKKLEQSSALAVRAPSGRTRDQFPSTHAQPPLAGMTVKKHIKLSMPRFVATKSINCCKHTFDFHREGFHSKISFKWTSEMGSSKLRFWGVMLRDQEMLKCLQEALHPPQQRNLRPGGKPDGAEQAWEFRELGGGPGYGPPSLLSVWENVSLCI